MGQKSNPIGLRLQINRTWDSRWYAEGRNYAQLLKEDIELRKYIIETLPQAAISKVVIERPAKLCRISIYAARPGVIIGKKGADIEKLRSTLATMTASEVKLNIVEIRKPEIDAKLVAQGVADQLVRRVAFRRAMKRAVQSPRSPASNGTAKAACRSIRCAPTSTMPKPRR
jgi:small subunit ribosomal protein S3